VRALQKMPRSDGTFQPQIRKAHLHSSVGGASKKSPRSKTNHSAPGGERPIIARSRKKNRSNSAVSLARKTR